MITVSRRGAPAPLLGELKMPTKEEVEALRAAYNDAERASQDALMAMATAKANVRETKKTATRARIRYHRALGELVADGGEDDGTPENP